jgi:hypothetical protein
MKKILFFLFLVFGINSIYANSPEFENNLKHENFSEIDKIEKIATQNQLDFESLKAENPELLENVSLDVNSINMAKGGDLPLGIPSLVWGFCCSVVGLALVYFTTDNDKDEVKKAAIGCLVGTLIGCGGWLLLGGTGSSYYYW